MLIERNKFIVIRRRDMIHENTNTIIMQQLYHKERTRTSFVVANYTIIFIILVHFIHRADLTNQVIMMTPVHGCTIYDTNAMYESTGRILFPACWLLIDWLVEIQRQPTLELAKVSHWKSCVQGSTHFNTSKQVLSIIHQAQCFILACYGRGNCKSLANTGKYPKARVTALNQRVFHWKRSPYTSLKLIYGEMLLWHTLPHLMQLSMIGLKMKDLGALHLNLHYSIESKL